LIVSGAGREVILWDAATGEKVRSWDLGAGDDTFVSAVAFSADGSEVVCAGSEGTIITMASSSGRELDRTITETVLCLNADGRYAVCQWGAAGRNGTNRRLIGVWDVIGKQWIRTFEWPAEWFAVEAHISHEGATLLLAGNDGYARTIAVAPSAHGNEAQADPKHDLPRSEVKSGSLTPKPLPPEVRAALSVLDLEESATFQEARDAYRKKVGEYHPDKVAHLGAKLRQLAEDMTQELNAAMAAIEDFHRGR
jgi:WD40 repeat protein